MATLKQRLHRKNSSGSYDTIYLETQASLVKMDDGTTLTSKISSMDTAINGKAASNHTHSNATTSAAGFMTGAMVTKLNGIATGANAYSHPSAKQCNYSYTHPSTKQCDAAAGNHTHSGYAASSHNHSAANITSGTLPVARGGTGVTSLDALRSALGSINGQFGSYVGKGTGDDNAISITFSFKPKFFMVYTYVSNGNLGVPVNANDGGTTQKIAIDALSSDYKRCYPLGYYCFAKFDSSSNTISYYDTRDGYSINVSGYTYYWMALG